MMYSESRKIATLLSMGFGMQLQSERLVLTYGSNHLRSTSKARLSCETNRKKVLHLSITHYIHTIICFSNNRSTIGIRVVDYFNMYLSLSTRLSHLNFAHFFSSKN